MIFDLAEVLSLLCLAVAFISIWDYFFLICRSVIAVCLTRYSENFAAEK